MATIATSRGNLTDLGTDGLGFIVPENPHESMYAFSLEGLQDCRASTFAAAGFREGDLVEFQLNEQHQVDRVTKTRTSTPKPQSYPQPPSRSGS